MDVTDIDTTESQLSAFLAEQLGTDAPCIANLQRIGVGRSRENWIFDLVAPTGETEPLILRRDPEGGLVETDRGVEFAVLTALEKCTVPAPHARWLDASGARLGRPSLIMRREQGSCDYGVVNGDRPLNERVALARSFCELLAGVHAIDWADLGLGDVLADPGPDAACAELSQWEQVLRKNQLEAYPELDLALDRLRRSTPTSPRTVLVHADFKPGNILLDDAGVTALLDWELAHLGDPLEDLGWVTQPLRTREHLIAGSWSAADLVGYYVEVTGHEVDPVALTWWQTFSTFKTAVMQVSGLRAFLDARSDEPFRPHRRVLSTLLAALPGAST